MFVDGLADPVDSGIISDGVVLRINQDHFVEFMCSVLGNPVAVQDSQLWEESANSFLGHASEISRRLELVDSDACWLTVDDTSVYRSLSTTSSDSGSVNDVANLGLISQSSGFIWSGWSSDSVCDGELSVFPGSQTENQSHDIRLFFLPELFEILVGTHWTWFC